MKTTQEVKSLLLLTYYSHISCRSEFVRGLVALAEVLIMKYFIFFYSKTLNGDFIRFFISIHNSELPILCQIYLQYLKCHSLREQEKSWRKKVHSDLGTVLEVNFHTFLLSNSSRNSRRVYFLHNYARKEISRPQVFNFVFLP